MNATVEFVSRFGSCGSSVTTVTGAGFEDLRDLVGGDAVVPASDPRIPSATTAVWTALSSCVRSVLVREQALRRRRGRRRASRPSGAASAAARSATGWVWIVTPCASAGLHDQRAEPCRHRRPAAPDRTSACRRPPYALIRMSTGEDGHRDRRSRSGIPCPAGDTRSRVGRRAATFPDRSRVALTPAPPRGRARRAMRVRG